MTPPSKKVEVRDLRLAYGPKEVIHGISFDLYENEILGVIGPAQSGKTSLLRCLNRTIDFNPGVRMSGSIKVDGGDIYTMDRLFGKRAANGSAARGESAPAAPTPADSNSVRPPANVYELRRKIGMVAPLPVGLPMSIYDNVAFAPRCCGVRSRSELDGLVEHCLTQAALWDEVKDRLDSLGTKLSGGQQQRLTIARALSHQPEILCLDEFSIAIDPVTTMRIEDVLKELRSRITIILVTNLVQQARRLANRTMFLFEGNIVELNDNAVVFSDQTQDRRTYEYVNGIFG
jgi:phosphate transport system ATP-binding protein